MIVSVSFPVSFVAATQVDVPVGTGVQDATDSVATLYDAANNIVNLAIQAISASTYRVTSEFPITADYRLVVVGDALITPPSPNPVPAFSSAPTVSQLKTYAQALAKIEADLDLKDETFISPNEMIGYFNEGIEEAESEILKLDEDYFLTSTPIPVVQGQKAYDYPSNIYGYKVRKIVYANGSVIYDVHRIRRKKKFGDIATTNQFGISDDYRWYHSNDSGGSPKINLEPASRETAIVPPTPGAFAPLILWYIRHANRVPLLGEYVQNWDILDQNSTVDPTTDEMIVSNAYVTGDKVKIYTTGSMPGGVAQGTVYYVIAGAGFIKLATTLQNAKTNIALDITSIGLGSLNIFIAANQSIIDNTIIDIPEFLKFVIQWVKCRCMEKDGDPRLTGAAETLTQQRNQMVSTLTEIQQDDENKIELDLSAYEEMS